MIYKQYEILNKYVSTFDVEPPFPVHISDDFYFKVLDDHIKKGEPVPVDFDWYPNLPENADV